MTESSEYTTKEVAAVVIIEWVEIFLYIDVFSEWDGSRSGVDIAIDEVL